MTDRSRKLMIVAVLAVAAAAVVARRERPAPAPSLPMAVAPMSSHDQSRTTAPSASSGRPRLVDLGGAAVRAVPHDGARARRPAS